MGRLFLIEFDEAPGKAFYLCRICRTHIALKEDLISMITSGTVGVFFTAVNLVTDEPAHHTRINADKVVADVFCTRCNMYLGFKFVHIKQPVDAFINVKGKLFIFMNGLLFCNEQQQLVAAI